MRAVVQSVKSELFAKGAEDQERGGEFRNRDGHISRPSPSVWKTPTLHLMRLVLKKSLTGIASE